MAFQIDSASTIDLGDLGISGYPFSVAGWLQTHASGVPSIAIFFSNSAEDAYHSIMFTGGTWAAAISYYHGYQGTAFTPNLIQCDRWHHIAAVFAAPDSRSIYIDGSLAGSNNSSCPFEALSQFVLGHADLAAPIEASEIVILDTMMPGDQIALLAKGVSPFTLPAADHVVCYHDLLRSVNRPGIGPEAGYATAPTVVPHNRVLQPHGATPVVRKIPISGPFFGTGAACHVPGANPAALFVPGVATDSSFSYAEAIS